MLAPVPASMEPAPGDEVNVEGGLSPSHSFFGHGQVKVIIICVTYFNPSKHVTFFLPYTNLYSQSACLTKKVLVKELKTPNIYRNSKLICTEKYIQSRTKKEPIRLYYTQTPALLWMLFLQITNPANHPEIY